MSNERARRRRRRTELVVLVLLVLAVIYRERLLKGTGSFLMATDATAQVDAVFVLGGSSYERGLEAVVMMDSGYVSGPVVCTGGNVPSILAALDTAMFEADCTKQFLENEGLPAERVVALTGSTSTQEESDEILAYCKQLGLSNIMVISSNLHMRRVRWVFEDKFNDAGIAVNFHGAPSQQWEDELWWKSEGGLIMVNNEYVKLFYYAVKY
ncbi:MAG: YdcF family protein [Flavobacteriales bacterium]